MNSFTYEFDELPLVISNGIPAGLINGCAEIKYTRYGEFDGFDGFCVEGYQERTAEERARGVRPWVYVTAPDELAALIEARLGTSEWGEKIQDAINEQLASDREEAAERRAESRREEMMLGR
jgi:hypothetical protein